MFMVDKTENMRRGPFTSEEISRHAGPVELLSSVDKARYLKSIKSTLEIFIIGLEPEESSSPLNAEEQISNLKSILLYKDVSDVLELITKVSPGNDLESTSALKVGIHLLIFFRSASTAPIYDDMQALVEWQAMEQTLQSIPVDNNFKKNIMKIMVGQQLPLQQSSQSESAEQRSVSEVTALNETEPNQLNGETITKLQ